MKTIVRDVISVLFVIGLVTGFASTPANAHASQPIRQRHLQICTGR